MATANIQLPDGTRVSIEGAPEEIARVLSLYGPRGSPADAPVPERAASNRVTNGAVRHLRELIAENFFTERRSLADVQRRLESLGHIFPVTHLSTPLRRLVIGKELRRLRAGRNWVYVSG